MAWDTVRYDANDISPYAQFQKAPGLVTRKFFSTRYHSGGDSLFFGNEGRTVLGYNDNRDGNNLLSTWLYYPFTGVTGADTIRDFSAILEFNLDTLTSHIDMDSAITSSVDSVPLLRLQIAFKDSGQFVNPYVPFKTASNTGASGWYLALDTTITRSIYRKLKDSWRSPDVLNGNSSSSTHSWTFKQLHVLLKPDSAMKAIILRSARGSTKFWYGNATTNPPLSGTLPQDNIVAGAGFLDTNLIRNTPLIEMEILSTYRDTVRIRSLCWQDTMADKYFHRIHYAGGHHPDSTHSADFNDNIGGLDDSIAKVLKTVAISVDSVSPRVQRGFLVNDFTDQTYLSASIVGLSEYLASKWGNLYFHIHEQDGGMWVQQFRRERMSHDGNPPSMFENEATIFYSSAGIPGLPDVFPLDYIYYGYKSHINFATTWPQSCDSIFGLQIGRVDNTADSLHAYLRYDSSYAGMGNNLTKDRGVSWAAMHHPKNKRYAIETGISGWGLSDPFTFHPQQRQTTPEETIGQTFGFIACGIGSLNNAQACDFAEWQTPWGPGIFAPPMRANAGAADSLLTHDYNWGHHRWENAPDTGIYSKPLAPVDSDGASGSTYLGYSNQYRAHVRVLQRINQIYPTYKYFTWRDAYCAHLSTNIANVDSTSKLNSFLKIQYTQPVNRWTRNADRSYIDSVGVKDLPTQTYVEVGLFDDSTKGNHAAMIVNTRLWPSLMDTEDVNYYNAGIPDSSKCHTTLGDIDVRKVFMKIDNSKLPTSDTASYYVVRDLWRPDTTWLVKSDSTFAIYLKPGDAKFLYIQKGYSILAAKKAEADTLGFSFNNGRRVAERVNSSQTVECYTRNHKLYVSYAAIGSTPIGSTYKGYNERSQGDAIATGYEQLLDSSFCMVPSITVGQNDSTVAIAYVKKSPTAGIDSVCVAIQLIPGGLRYAGQHHHYERRNKCADRASGFDGNHLRIPRRDNRRLRFHHDRRLPWRREGHAGSDLPRTQYLRHDLSIVQEGSQASSGSASD